MYANAEFVVEVDAAARAWLDSHKSEGPRVITYEVHLCCGGGKICNVRVLIAPHRDDFSNYAVAVLPDRTKIVIDPERQRGCPRNFVSPCAGWALRSTSISSFLARSGDSFS